MNVETTPPRSILKSLIAKGDLAQLTEEERCQYYLEVCRSAGLNPMTLPFAYLRLDGRLVLYARRDCADQLRKLHGISIEILEKSRNGDLLTIHVRARDITGRMDEDVGVVNLATLKGEAAANAALKAVTKAKRRVTLSISGLGFMDETEVEAIPVGRCVGGEEGARAAESLDPGATIKEPAIAASSPPSSQTPLSIAADRPMIFPSRLAQRPCESTGVFLDPIVQAPGSIPITEINGRRDVIGWAQIFLKALDAAVSADDVAAWQSANCAALEEIASEAPLLHKRVLGRLGSAQQRFSAGRSVPTSGDGAQVDKGVDAGGPDTTDPEATEKTNDDGDALRTMDRRKEDAPPCP
jgi:hypothetical protein